MDLSRLRKLDDYRWTTAAGPGRVLLYGSGDLLVSMDDKVLEQISNVASLPGIVGPAMTMPDAHCGYGFPIGGVATFDPEEGGGVSAGGVGYDISCGIRCLRTDLEWSEIAGAAWPLAEDLFRCIPAGVGAEGDLRLSGREMDEMLFGSAQWAVEQGFGCHAEREYVEEGGCMAGALPEFISERAKKRQAGETGTLGSGNHYLEVHVVERVFDPAAGAAFGVHEGQVLVSIHCGSRGLGHQVGSDYLLAMAKAASGLGIRLPDRELACAPIRSALGQEYLGAMRAGINCALANRQSFARLFPEARLETLYDVSHNTCKEERHLEDGRERVRFVHRKGATR